MVLLQHMQQYVQTHKKKQKRKQRRGDLQDDHRKVGHNTRIEVFAGSRLPSVIVRQKDIRDLYR